MYTLLQIPAIMTNFIILSELVEQPCYLTLEKQWSYVKFGRFLLPWEKVR